MSLLNFSHYKSFEEEKIAVLSLICLIHSIPFNDNNSFYETVDLQNGVTIKRKKSTGNFLSLVKDYEVLKSYQNLKVYTSEDEMALLCPDRVLYYYQDDDYIKNIDIVGQYVYIISEKEACSGVEINDDEVDNFYFANFSAFVLQGETSFYQDEYSVSMKYDEKEKTFRICYKNAEDDEAPENLLLEIRNISKSISYPYVLFVLKSLERTSDCILTNCKVTKIVKK